MHGSEHASGLAYGLAVFYLLCFVLNAGFAAYYWLSARDKAGAGLWGAGGALFLLQTLIYLAAGLSGGGGPALPQSARDAIDWVMGPITYTALSVIGFVAVLYFRRFFTQPVVGL